MDFPSLTSAFQGFPNLPIALQAIPVSILWPRNPSNLSSPSPPSPTGTPTDRRRSSSMRPSLCSPLSFSPLNDYSALSDVPSYSLCHVISPPVISPWPDPKFVLDRNYLNPLKIPLRLAQCLVRDACWMLNEFILKSVVTKVTFFLPSFFVRLSFGTTGRPRSVFTEQNNPSGQPEFKMENPRFHVIWDTEFKIDSKNLHFYPTS